MQSLTRNQDVAVMGDKILDDLLGAVDDVDVTPVDPRMFWFHGCGEQVISGFAHLLSSRALGSKAMS